MLTRGLRRCPITSGMLGALAQRKVGDESSELTEALEHLPS